MSPEEKKKKKARQDVEAKWKDIGLVKGAYSKAMSSYSAVVEQVATVKQFKYFAEEMVEVVTPLKEALDVETRVCEFNRAFIVQDLVVLKKKFDPASVELGNIKTRVSELQVAVDRIIRMANAR